MAENEKKSIVKQETYIEKRFDTGEEITKTVNITARFSAEPRYIKLYSKDFSYLNSLTKGEILILFALLKRVDFATNGMEIVLNQTIKSRILKEISLKNIGTINNAISKFIKIGLFRRPSDVDYNIHSNILIPNPYFFGKGDWADIANMREFFSPSIIKIHKLATAKNVISTTNTDSQKDIPDNYEEALYSKIEAILLSIRLHLENLYDENETTIINAENIIVGYIENIINLTKEYPTFKDDILPIDEKDKIKKMIKSLDGDQKFTTLIQKRGLLYKWGNLTIKFSHA